jgi:hypothetical protein
MIAKIEDWDLEAKRPYEAHTEVISESLLSLARLAFASESAPLGTIWSFWYLLTPNSDLGKVT